MLVRRARRLLPAAALMLSAGFSGCAATKPRAGANAERPDPAAPLARMESAPTDSKRLPPIARKRSPGVVTPASYESSAVDEPTATTPATDAVQAEVSSSAGASANPMTADSTLPELPAADAMAKEDSVATSPQSVEAVDPRQPQLLDLATVMQLVDGQNPQVQYARERIQEALAKVDRADALWLPSIRAGVNWNKHEGRIQDVAGKVIDTSRGSYFTGFGSDAVGAGSPRVPGLLAQFHLADAVFEPRIAQSAAHARQFGSQAATNDALLDSSLLYLALLKAHQELAIAREAQLHTQQLANLTALYAKTGQGVVADDDRARAELAVRENDVQRGIEEIQVASARLAEQLRLDPSLRFEPREPVAVPLEFQTQNSALPQLVAFGITHRPEVSENRSLAIEASERLRREQYATLVPSVILAMSYGGLAGGFGSDFVNWGDRLDVDAIAWWEVRNLGFGERAARGEARSKLQQAQWKEIAVLDRVAREVVEAQAQVESRRRQLAIAETGIRAAEDSFQRNLERIRHAQGLPLEVLQSIQALAQARREYLRVVISYNEAQFKLQRALGWPVESVGPAPSE